LMKKGGSAWIPLAISLVGVIYVAVFLLRLGPTSPASGGVLVWAVFSVMCLLGAVATLFPHRCSSSVNVPSDLDESRYTMLMGIRLVHGHHPGCGKFGGHELVLNGKTFCAGCTGLFAGAIAALSTATLYFIFDYRPPALAGYVGLGFVVLGLLYNILLKEGPPFVRTALNFLFVLGFALILVAVDGVGDPGLDLFAIGLCTYWMFTRIQLSRWSHDRICGACDEDCDRKSA
jgi:hypothetical protein